MIREANPADFAAIARLQAQLFHLHFARRPDMIKPKEEPFSREEFEACLADGDAKLFVYEEGGQILGHCTTKLREFENHPVFFDMKILEIEDLCVDDGAKRKGIGRQLFQRAKEYGKEQGAVKLELMVWHFNENARRFYERLGMTERIRRMEMGIE